MKYINILSLILVFSLLSSSHTLAMEEELEESSKAPSLSFEDQLISVATFAFKQQENKKPLKMILGCNNTDERPFFNEDWVFLDITEHDATGRPYIRADFNRIDQLDGIASMLGSQFQEIVLDDSTYKATAWNQFHLKQLASLLEDNGKFVFVPEIGQSAIIPTIVTDEHKFFKALQTYNIFPENWLPTSLKKPIFRGPSEKEEKLLSQFKREVFIPHIKKIITPYFKEIEIQENAPYPIPSHYDGGNDNTVFICKNPTR